MDDSRPIPTSAKKVERRFPRYRADFRVNLEIFRPGGSVSLWGLCSEIGEDGISATLTGTLALAEVVSMELLVPAIDRPLKFRAIVRYSDGLRHGFEFLALTAEQRSALHRTCVLLSNSR